MKPVDYFKNNELVIKKKYDALREYFLENNSADVVAKKYSYTLFAFYSLIRDFKKFLNSDSAEDYFFKNIKSGRKPKKDADILNEIIIDLRKKNYSAEDILTILHSKGYKISYGYVYDLLHKEGFAGLSKRSKNEKYNLTEPKITAPVSEKITITNENFFTNTAGIFCFLPLIKKYGIDKVIYDSEYPSTKSISKFSSILSFVALKVSCICRYSSDDLWCIDRGSGLFSGLTALPKCDWYSSYSHRITRNMNLSFLKNLNKIWLENNLLSDTRNLYFKTIPYWDDDEHLENNCYEKKNKSLSSMLIILSQDSDSGIIDYGDTNVIHINESAVVLEYLDFYKKTNEGVKDLKHLVFDSKFTNYENLAKLDNQNIKFITNRRRGKNIIKNIETTNSTQWKKIRVEASGFKKRSLKVISNDIILKGFSNNTKEKNKKIRQIIITGHGKIKPAIIITNDYDTDTEIIVKKYSRIWLIEKEIDEQINFFHINRVSSSMDIKVDFDLTMSILSHNLYRLLAKNFDRDSHLSNQKLYEKFIENAGNIKIKGNNICVELKKKRNLPQLLTLFSSFNDYEYDWLNNCCLSFTDSSSS